jgi:alpha-glucoside transport system permease protein
LGQDLLQQVLYAALTVAIALSAFLAYYWGANWLLDRSLVTNSAMSHEQITRRDKLRSRIRPWIFIVPALLFLGIYLVYPVFETLRLSFYDRLGQDWVGFSNYTWAFGNPADWFRSATDAAGQPIIDAATGLPIVLNQGDPGFWQAALNNLAWLAVVPALSTALGLIIAVLADRVWWGWLAKTLIFMPMAISFVGAAVIWGFVYDYRGPEFEQIGLLNAIVVAIGGEPKAWMTIPWVNSVLLMIILVWIQTGFAMVILSAALRGIPSETIEAARIDGANERQIFFGIMIPQIGGTILVVWTTITIIVLKVFDIVFAMTNGENGTQVLANLMYRLTFRSGDYGRGSAVAIIIMLAVLPIMIWNIRRERRAAKAT